MSKKFLSLLVGGTILLNCIPCVTAMANENVTPNNLIAHESSYVNASNSMISRAYEGMYEAKVINCSSLTVKSYPSLSSDPVGWLQAGDKVMVEHSYEADENPGWNCLSFVNKNGKFIRGYVKSYYLQKIR